MIASFTGMLRGHDSMNDFKDIKEALLRPQYSPGYYTDQGLQGRGQYNGQGVLPLRYFLFLQPNYINISF